MATYSFYKIVCNDLDVKYTYVGSTQNFTRRKHEHKRNCINSNFKVYTTIRENGGWDNWKMIEIEKKICNDKREAELNERYWYEELNAELNTHRPRMTEQEQKEMKARDDKKYQETHKEQIRETRKIWEENNKEHLTEYKKNWYEENKDRTYECECGSIVSYSAKERHFRTQKHKDYLTGTIREKIPDSVLKANYREKNKKITYECECGEIVCKLNKARHERTKKHQEIINER